NCTAESDVVLEGDLRAVDLTLVRGSAELPGEFGALREACCSEGVALRDEAAGRVDHPASAVGGVVGVDELAAVTFGAQSKCLVGQQLVGGEAVVEFDDVDVVGGDPGLGVYLLGGLAGHVCA